MLIHRPELPCRHLRMGIPNLLDQVGQFFFHAAWASGSDRRCCGRGTYAR
jgi:hypothetical protein